jgi:hypothetical protein
VLSSERKYVFNIRQYIAYTRGGQRSPVRILALIMVFLAAFSSRATADWRQFIPKITDYAGFLTVEGSYETHEDRVDVAGQKRSDLFFRQIVELAATGYVYHPRFIVYYAGISGGLKEEKSSGLGQRTSWDVMNAEEYDFSALVLPEHPYNLELFTRRMEPLAKGQLSQQFTTVAYSSGAIFRYKKKPYFLNVHYLRNSTDYASGSYTTSKYGFLGTYHKEIEKEGGNTYSFAVAYDHQDSSASGFGSTTDDASLSNTISFRKVHLSSGLSFHMADQQGGVGGISLSAKSFSWNERGQVSLPWNFSADLSYVLSKDWLKTGGDSLQEANVSNTNQNAAFSLTHRLYDSLISTYSAGYSSLRSDSGNSSTISNSLGFAYVKRVPLGRLRATFSAGISDTTATGSQPVVNEPHDGVTVPFGDFTLNERDVDPASIVVFLKSPLVPGALVDLRENIDYFVLASGGTVQIALVNLPPAFVVPGTYDFSVTYTVRNRTGGFKVRTLSSTISYLLFGEMIIPYWNHSESKETLKEGFTGVVPFSVASDQWGLTFNRRPFSAAVRYELIRSTFTPSKGWKAELNYIDTFFQHTQVQASVMYGVKSYPNGIATVGFGSSPYRDKLFGASAGVQQRIPKINLFVYAGGSYSKEKGLGEATTYSLNSNVMWAVGKLLVNGGATASFSDSVIGGIVTKRVDQYYYLSLKRKLF